jgi:hypothetical protein
MPKKSDLEFHVSLERGSATTVVFKNFDKAATHAVAQSISTGEPVVVDVVTWTKAAARKWGGDSAVEIYEDDPEASVHERIVVRAGSQGRIP